MLADLIAEAARVIATTEHPRDGLAAAASAIRRATGAPGVALFRNDHGRLTQAYEDCFRIPSEPLTESSLRKLGDVYPLSLGGRAEGVALLAQTTSHAAPSEDAGLAALFDLAAVALRNDRLSEERTLAQRATRELADEAVSRAEALTISEGRLRALLDTMTCGVVVQSESGRVLETNAVAAGVTGLPIESLIGGTNADLGELYREDGTELKIGTGPGSRALRSGVPIRKEILRHVSSTGTTTWLEVDSVPVLGAGGRPAQVVSTFVDVTERKQSEAREHDAQERLAILVEASALLLGSRDYRSTLQELAALLAARMDACCIVDVVDHELLLRVGVAVSDPSQEQLGDLLRDRYPREVNSMHAPSVILERSSVFRPTISYDGLSPTPSMEASYLELMQRLDVHSSMAVPLASTGRVMGVLRLLASTPGRFSRKDLALLEDIGRRAGQAVENAMLFDAARAAEASLGAQLAFTQMVVNSLGEGLYVIDAEGLITLMNTAAEELLGWREADIRGKDSHELLHYQYSDGRPYPRDECPLIKVVESGVPYIGEDILITHDEMIIPVDVIMTAILRNGEITGAVCAFQDTTARKRAEKEIGFQAHLLDVVNQSVVAADSNGIVIYWNRYAEQLFGWTGDEARGQAIGALMVTEDLHGTWKETLGKIARGESWTGELMLRRKDGTSFPALVTDSPILDENGKSIGIVGASVDISDRKRAEQAMQESEERLIQAQKMEAIGILAGGIAHDFNNILTAILGFSELVSIKLPVDSPLFGYMTQIIGAAERAANLTRQLLAFSRRQVLLTEILDLNSVVSDLVRFLQQIIGEDIHLITRAGQNLRPVQVDRGQIEQVIMNLVVNARDAMPQGGRLTIETQNVELDSTYFGLHAGHDVGISEPGPYVMLAVTDTGTGIDPVALGRIFDPFFTTKEEGKGTGLGLSTVYGIVRQSGGDIWASSEPGRGAAFKIYLPPVVEVGANDEQPVLSAPMGGTETILVVEDSPAVLELTRSVLAAQGYQVLTASSAEDALELCRDRVERIDLLLTDLVLPGVNGRELADQIIATRDLRVLYMSGYTDDVAARNGIQSAEVAFLQKPFTPWVLSRKVREVLDRK